MKKLYSLIISAFIFNLLIAQDPCASLNYHAFKTESLAGTYSDLGNLGSEIQVSNLDDGISDPLNIGFEFVYQCQIFDAFIFNTNGFIKLGTETTPKTNLFFSEAQSTNGGIFNDTDSNNVNLIVVFNHDIETISPDPDFRVHTSGIAPDRVCTIQWKNMQEWSSDPATKQYLDMNFQLKLYETSNVIEFVYGEWGPSANTSNYKTAAVGLKGASNEDDQLLVVVKSSAGFWENVTFHNGNYASNESFNFGNPPDRPKPDVGRTYRFTPTNYNDLTIKQVYALGDASSYYSSPQSISAAIQNSGFNTQSVIPVILEVSGSNTFRDTQYIAGLDFMEAGRVTFASFKARANGPSLITVRVGDDDFAFDNEHNQLQRLSDLDLNYTLQEPATDAYGFLSGVQGVYYAKYPVHGTAKVTQVNVFMASNLASIGKTVFGLILNEAGNVVARSENHVIEESDLNTWRSFTFATPPMISNAAFYAGFGMTSSLTEYAALGVQQESPIRPGTYYKSLITGSGLQPMDTLTFSNRFMIGATLAGTEPIAGTASEDLTLCTIGQAVLLLDGHTGFIKWQHSSPAANDWIDVTEGVDPTLPAFTTGEITTSTNYRAEVSQPGFPPVYSNTVHVEVLAETPVITSSGDALLSSSDTGNQWYDQNGMISGATNQLFLALLPGTYYVIVHEGDCISPPSNTIDLITVGMNNPGPNPDIKILPNPASNFLTIQTNATSLNPQALILMNVFGQIVIEKEWQPTQFFDTSQLSGGLYLVIARYMQDIQVVGKVMKQE